MCTVLQGGNLLESSTTRGDWGKDALAGGAGRRIARGGEGLGGVLSGGRRDGKPRRDAYA